MSTAAARRMGRTAPPVRVGFASALGACLVGAVASVLASRSPTAALTLALAPPTLWLATRSYGGIAFGLVIVLTVPYWLSIGAAQATALRLASLIAASTILFARGLRPCFTDYALAMLVVIIVLGWLLQYDEPHVGHVVSTELTPLGFYFGARGISRQRSRLIMLVSLFAGTLGAGTVLYEFWRGHAIFIDPASYVWNASDSTVFRPGGIFGSPPGASTVLCIVILLGFAAARGLRGRSKAIAVACLITCSLALVSTLTRGGIIAAGAGLLVVLWLTRSRLVRPLRVMWFAAAVAALVVLLLPRIATTPTFQEAVVRSGNLGARESYWQTALPLATGSVHNFLFGVGTGIAEAPSISSQAPIPAAVAVAPTLTQNSLHNEYVSTLFEQGAVGVLALIVFLVSVFVPTARRARAAGDATCAAVAGCVVAIGLVMTVNTALLHGPSFAMIMVVAGLGVSAASGQGLGASDSHAQVVFA